MSITKTTNRYKTVKGFTLLEVLIALLVFSIGLLGLAGLQLQGLKFNQSAYQRSQATLLAYDILDRMRSNRTLADGGSYNITLANTGTVRNCTGASTCSTSDIADYDLYEWKQALAETLPQGNGSVTPLGGTPVNYHILVEWSDDRENPDATKMSLSLRTAP